MGTNYYVRYNECRECKRFDELHLGKSSAGWKFLFRGHSGDISIRSKSEWLEFFSHYNCRIFDEYNEEISLDNFLKLVENKQSNKTQGQGTCNDFNGYEFLDAEFS